jgi:spore germination protein YaaH
VTQSIEPVKRTFSLAIVVVLGAIVGPFSAAAGVASATPLPSTVESWIYPASAGQPACDAPSELSALSADPISMLKPEYLTVSGRGRVLAETSASLPCNGYSAANLAAVRAAARKVYVTVSANGRAAKAMLGNAGRRSAALSSIETFVATNRLDGVDLDFEPNAWSSTTWNEYMGFVSAIVAQMNTVGRGVEVDLFPFTTTPWDAVRYGDVAAVGAHVVVMAYDHEFDIPCAPISPYSWLRQVVTYAQSQVSAADLTIGIPAYGYTTTTCKRIAHVASNVAYVAMQAKPGFPTTAAQISGLRDPSSGEIRWSSGGSFYDFVDATALNAKLAVVEALGVDDVSVWSLGGEPWFSGNPS